jgi:hypothetical protein
VTLSFSLFFNASQAAAANAWSSGGPSLEQRRRQQPRSNGRPRLEQRRQQQPWSNAGGPDGWHSSSSATVRPPRRDLEPDSATSSPMTSTSTAANDEEATLILKPDEHATLVLKPGAMHTVTPSSSTASWSLMILTSTKQAAALDKQVVVLDLGSRL